MSATKLAVASPFLYQTQLGHLATVSVTHNAHCQTQPYSGNLGLHVNDDPVAVVHRRAALETAIGKPIQWLNQVHGVDVFVAGSNESIDSIHSIESHPTADAAVTEQNAIALAVMTADCLPVVLCAFNDAGQSAIGVAHAGWRGLLNGVIEATVITLSKRVPQAVIHAHLGPCIGVAQFEVGSDVRGSFVNQNKSTAVHFTPFKQDKYLCDLESLARMSLSNCGVASVTGGGWCTVSDPRLASYRRNPTTGRFATVVSLN
jgi:polyphenol oxidase